jgi:hypothetical protein
MRTQRLLGVVFLVCLGLSVSVIAKRPASLTPVTSIISDYDSGVAPALQIQSDKLGAYTNSKTLISNIINDSTGTTWGVDSYYVRNATRTLALSFTQPIPGTGPNGGAPVSPPSGYYKARIGSECYRYNNSMWTLPPGQTMACPMNVHFDYGGKTYDLHMSDLNVNFPETNHVNITCIYPTSGMNPCSQWRIWPSGTYVAPDGTTQERNVANLSYETTVNNQLAYVKQGDFYVSFSIIVTYP